jgi:chlorosome envelope protein B
MANETANEFTSAINNLVDVIGKLGQQQVELITNGIKSASEAIEPLCKTSFELVGNVFNACTQVLANVSAAITPKK